MERHRVVSIILCGIFGLLGALCTIAAVVLWDIGPLAIFVAFAGGFAILCAVIALINTAVFGPVLWVFASIVAFYERTASSTPEADRPRCS